MSALLHVKRGISSKSSATCTVSTNHVCDDGCSGATSAFCPKQTCRKTQSLSLLGVKRTWPIALHMSAFDPKRTLAAKICCDAQRSCCSRSEEAAKGLSGPPSNSLEVFDQVSLVGVAEL